MTSNLLEHSVEDIFRTIFDAGATELLIVNPSARAFRSLVDLASAVDKPPRTRLLAEERTVKDVLSDFIVASHAADLVNADRLEIRTVENGPENALVIAEDEVIALVTIGETVAGLNTDDRGFVTVAFNAYDEEWEEAEPFILRTPPLSRVRDTLANDIGPEVAADFDRVLDSLPAARTDGEGLDEVTISLLVAAKNDVLLYDISKWGEDVGIASKATFSRTKTRLEDMGVIDTEKVPIDVGRPRLRLKLGDDRLAEASIDELGAIASTIMSD